MIQRRTMFQRRTKDRAVAALQAQVNAMQTTTQAQFADLRRSIARLPTHDQVLRTAQQVQEAEYAEVNVVRNDAVRALNAIVKAGRINRESLNQAINGHKRG